MRKLLVITALTLFAGIAFGQTLKKGVVLGTHAMTVTLNPDVTMNQYLDFFNNKFKPEFEKHYPGMKIFILKGTRGENEFGYGLLYWIESIEVRDKYWPEPDEASDIGRAAREKMQPIIDEWRKMEVSFSTEYTDWVIL